MRSTMLQRTLGLGVAIVLTTLLSTSCTPNDSPTANSPGTPTVKDEITSSFLPEVPRISVEEVKAKMDAGANIVILDTRSKDAYDKCHVAGAVSIETEPFGRLASYEEILLYCA